jgi:mRNA interferase MazF
MRFNRGDVVLVLFPDSNLLTAKKRPALVVQSDSLDTGLNQKVVAMISSNMVRARFPSRIAVLKASPLGLAMGLHTDSVIMADNLATILDMEIDRKIGFCNDMQTVGQSLKATLDLL